MDYQQLRKAIQHSRKRLQPYREKRVRSIREFVGRNYSDTGSRDRVPVNMLELFISTYSRQLVANRPNVMIRPRVRRLAPQADELQLATNHVLGEMDIETTLRLAVIDALFSMGIVKVGVTEPKQEPMRVSSTRPGSPSLSVSVWMIGSTICLRVPWKNAAIWVTGIEYLLICYENPTFSPMLQASRR